MKRFLLLTALALASTRFSQATETAVPASTTVESDSLRFGSLSVYIENDKFFAGTDHNYTNGVKLSLLSTNLRAFDSDTVPGPLRALSRTLHPLMSDEAIPKLGLSLGQQIYTPTDTQTPLDQPADRPYAAWLYTGFTFQNYYPSSPEDPYACLSTIELQFGAAGGDWALGEYVQNNYHKLIKVETAKGWSHQIDSEPGVNLVYEQKWRWSTAGARTGLGADLIPHAGFSLGNVFTYANTGAAFRLGYALPSDFGTNLIRPSGDSNATRRAPFGIWLFGQVDGRAVARDITLDGNTFSGGPSIEKQAFVADLVGGIGVGTTSWQFTYAQALRTKEFKGQTDDQAFGSLSLTYFY
jgi:lipid A 3-O-deacylase